MLSFVKERFEKFKHFGVVKEEIKLFNIVKVVLDGGYVFCKDTLKQAFDYAGISLLQTQYD